MSSASLYARYVAERGDAQIIELPQGFGTYKIINQDQIYLMDVFVLPEFRRTKIASELATMVGKIGKEKGCKELITTVMPNLNGSTISLKLVLSYGFQLKSSSDNLILFSKELV